MGFYMRKSVSFGGIRFNLSNSGIGVSVGVKGFRFGRNTRGNYVHIGRNGLYYRAALNSSSEPVSQTKNMQNNQRSIGSTTRPQLLFHDIDSEDVALLTDSSSQDLISEISHKQKHFVFWPFAFIFVIIPKFGIAISLTLVLLMYLLIDKPRKTTLLFYDIDDKIVNEIQQFYDSFNELMQCTYSWHISAKAHVFEEKYYAGASKVVKRTPIKINYKTPSVLKTNVQVPCIPVGRQKLYFLPDRILVTEKASVAAISYDNITVTQTNSRFIESGVVPTDSQKVGQTWRYVNKNGGPDRRFKDNRALPILLYSELHFTSPSGLNEIIQLSKSSIGSDLNMSLKLYSLKSFLTEESKTPSLD